MGRSKTGVSLTSRGVRPSSSPIAGPKTGPLSGPVQAEVRRGREPDAIEVRGAREHNLDVPFLTIPKRAFVVFTGPSGSGKSSLAFDTLYACLLYTSRCV